MTELSQGTAKGDIVNQDVYYNDSVRLPNIKNKSTR